MGYITDALHHRNKDFLHSLLSTSSTQFIVKQVLQDVLKMKQMRQVLNTCYLLGTFTAMTGAQKHWWSLSTLKTPLS